MKNNLGLIYALAAYTCWGIIPVFWKQLNHVDSIEIVMHRMVWSCALVTALIIASRQWREFVALFSQTAVLLKLFIASALVSLNWAVFIWAVNTGHLVETSLGYFMNPLISVALGVVMFGEALRSGQIIALAIATSGVVYLVVSHGSFIPALIYLSYIEFQGTGQFFSSPSNAWMLVLAGLFTLIPLVLFAAAAKRISMTALGMTQYIGPTLQLLIGVLLYREPFGAQKVIAFGLIWLALGVYSVDQLNYQREARRQRRLRA